MAGSTALAFGALVAGAVVLDYGVKNAKGAFATADPLGSTSTPTGTGAGGSVVTPSPATGGFPAAVDPLPGAVGSRLDQGVDATAQKLLSTWAGTVVKAPANDPGWKGGGYVAIQSSADMSRVYYVAEGLLPTVKVGDTVTAGQTIANPVANPYNGIVGNIEAGLANPSDFGQPLAQVTSAPAAMVTSFYNWLRTLGGPLATSTSSAGHA